MAGGKTVVGTRLARWVVIAATAVMLCACAGLLLHRIASLERRVAALGAQLDAALRSSPPFRVATVRPPEDVVDRQDPAATPSRVVVTMQPKHAAAQWVPRHPATTKPVPNTLCVKGAKAWTLEDALADVSFRFGVLGDTEFGNAKKVAATARNGTAAAFVARWWNWVSNPHRYSLLRKARWSPGAGGVLASPKNQDDPSWPQNDGSTYFRGYTYPARIPCPGSPHECFGRGVCDTTRGACVCRPPWTGWACKYNYLDKVVPLWDNDTQPHTWHPRECGAEIVTDPKVEKWNKRAAERCRSANGTTRVNGMWLGLTQGHSRTIALSIANALGLEEGQSVLDIGMGCGDMLLHIRTAYPQVRVMGLDYSKPAVELVRERFATDENSHNVFCVADVRNLSFVPTNSVDVAYESGVFSVTRDGHCETYRNAIRLLKRGGTLLIHQTFHDQHTVKCWQNINMQSVERCLAPTGVLIEHILTRDLSNGAFDTYCAGETWAMLIRKPLHADCSPAPLPSSTSS